MVIVIPAIVIFIYIVSLIHNLTMWLYRDINLTLSGRNELMHDTTGLISGFDRSRF